MMLGWSWMFAGIVDGCQMAACCGASCQCSPLTADVLCVALSPCHLQFKRIDPKVRSWAVMELTVQLLQRQKNCRLVMH